MNTVKVYLDNCCFNRPYDDQRQLRIELETKAKLHIQQQIVENKLLLVLPLHLNIGKDLRGFFSQDKETVTKRTSGTQGTVDAGLRKKYRKDFLYLGAGVISSDILEFENNENPYLLRKSAIGSFFEKRK